MSFSYALQKATSALATLTSDRALDQRLVYAGQELLSFPIQELPESVTRTALEAERAFTMWPDSPAFETPDGYCSALINYLPDCRKAQLAEKVVRLHREVCEAQGARGAGAIVPPVGAGLELASPEKWEFLYWGLGSDATASEQTRYTEYARHWLPNFPAEVLLEWQGRHGYESMRTWAHLDLETLVFEEELWSYNQLTQIQAIDSGFTEVGPHTQGGYHINRKGDWTGEYINKHHTWSAPIIVIEHPVAVSEGYRQIPAGLVLIEGHNRLSRMLNFATDDRNLAIHRVMRAQVTS